MRFLLWPLSLGMRTKEMAALAADKATKQQRNKAAGNEQRAAVWRFIFFLLGLSNV